MNNNIDSYQLVDDYISPYLPANFLTNDASSICQDGEEVRILQQEMINLKLQNKYPNSSIVMIPN